MISPVHCPPRRHPRLVSSTDKVLTPGYPAPGGLGYQSARVVVVKADLFLLLRLVTEGVRVRRDASVPPGGGEDEELGDL